ncbi:MAG: hypothetical protein A2758_00140 [Candidatus Zambryskibacteria bacterium RIFCSPHIGHO2_01_FULL_49_18]|uniref:Peptidoglycan binding-like domain-containing protein n=2 Tax=Candidatus Zambryskiibacteriota TaxID=1817925 RepID=A0A1G2T2K1_9BACT|nr:MAG: hypothetical protein A2758_00140 [Candidatus Zambryskibacteria bacterium RIFCSPHIGHO2_01_FULL_49_18]OHB05705.1 MAG: hypothetical protein A3A26_02390 [Candidatus Zambryskibacteria bacterium RIFCSPLOWO2_01_FULL_47_14]
MKKLLIPALVLGSFLPAMAFAAYNDVSLTTNARISSNSITLDVSGTDAAVESLAVGSGTFTAVLQSGSNLKVSPSSNTQMVYDVTYTGSNAPQVDYVCTAATSTLTVTASSQTTLVVTPLSTACSGPGESTSGSTGSSGSSSGGGGGGGGTTVAVAPNPVPVAAQATYSTKEAQIQSIMQAIAALQAQMQALTGAPAAQVSAVSGKITSNLSAGSRGSSVKTLQQFLNTRGFAVASSGPGSPGRETEMFGSLTVKAVQKFQEQYGIAKPGVPGYGTVGPKTRAKINELSGN